MNLAENLGPEQAEKIATKIIRNKMTNEDINLGEAFQLKTFGPPISAKFGRPENKIDRANLNTVSFETIKELQLNLDLSKRGTKKLISSLKKSAKVETGIHDHLERAEKELAENYHIKTCTFETSSKETETRNLILVKDVPSFIADIMKKRDIDPETAVIRVGMDGGGGFFKICVNVFDPEEYTFEGEDYADAGVQKIQFLAIVQEIPETYMNVKTILEKLKLDEVDLAIGKFIAHSCNCHGNSYRIKIRKMMFKEIR